MSSDTEEQIRIAWGQVFDEQEAQSDGLSIVSPDVYGRQFVLRATHQSRPSAWIDVSMRTLGHNYVAEIGSGDIVAIGPGATAKVALAVANHGYQALLRGMQTPDPLPHRFRVFSIIGDQIETGLDVGGFPTGPQGPVTDEQLEAAINEMTKDGYRPVGFVSVANGLEVMVITERFGPVDRGVQP